MTKTKKQYSEVEKTKIALEAIKDELTIAPISSKYGVKPPLLVPTEIRHFPYTSSHTA